MAEQVVIKAETVQAWAVQPTDDGRQTAIVFKVKTGTAGFSFPPDDFSRFAEKMVSQAGKLVDERVPGATLQTADALPLPVNSISIEPHPEDSSSALLAVQLGRLRLVFAVDVTMLLQSCKQFVDQRRSARASVKS